MGTTDEMAGHVEGVDESVMHDAIFDWEGCDVAPLAFGHHANGVTAGGSPCAVEKTVGEAEEIAVEIDLVVES